MSLSSSLFLVSVFVRLIKFLSTQVLWLPEDDSPILSLVFVDLLLVAIFILQHTMMASHSFRKRVKTWGLAPLHRTGYNVATCLVLNLLIGYWQPISGVSLWLLNVPSGSLLWTFFFLLHTAAWCVIVLELLIMDPLEFIGVKSVYYYVRDWYSPTYYMSAKLRHLFEHMRHPGATALLLILWLHPLMTLDRAMLAFLWTFYLSWGHRVTERDYIFVEDQVYSKTVTWKKIQISGAKS
ncbi:hypothetical protein ScPMuIL_015006 [Solemya velum]